MVFYEEVNERKSIDRPDENDSRERKNALKYTHLIATFRQRNEKGISCGFSTQRFQGTLEIAARLSTRFARLFIP